MAFSTAMALTRRGGISTYLTSINKFGTIVGHYQLSSGGPEQGFEYSHGTYTPIEFPGAISTVPISINDKGQITGYYQTSSTIDPQHAFVYSNGQYTSIDPPGSTETTGFRINNSAQVVGAYSSNNANYSFVATDPPSPTTAPHQDLAAATLQLVQAAASFSPAGSVLNAGPFNQMNDDVMHLSNQLARPH
jgi:probable HAF family extracellular repeat protein